MGRKTSVVVGALAVGAFVGGVAGSQRAQPIPAVETGATVAGSSSVIEVHVAGWVVQPGVVTLDEKAIVADAVEAAGGMKPGARPDLINLAAAVQAGEQVVVPGPETGAGGDVMAGDGALSLNRADASDLETLPGVGPVLAGRIVAFRDENGPFGNVEDLLQVAGIGEAKLASLRDLVTVP